MISTPTDPTLIKPYHTQGKDDWGTATPLYQKLHQEFEFTLDVCADDQNHKCAAYLTKEMDALSVDWWGRVFMNPPFTLLDKFLYKLIMELLAGHIEMGVALIASRTDTQAMFTASSYAGETRFLKGRVAYEVYPTAWQRQWCETFQAITIDPKAWPGLVKDIGLPKTAIQALIKDPEIPGGDPKLAQVAPFPSTVLIFDRRKTRHTVYWDWKKGLKPAYYFSAQPAGALGMVGEIAPKVAKPAKVTLFATHPLLNLLEKPSFPGTGGTDDQIKALVQAYKAYPDLSHFKPLPPSPALLKTLTGIQAPAGSEAPDGFTWKETDHHLVVDPPEPPLTDSEIQHAEATAAQEAVAMVTKLHTQIEEDLYTNFSTDQGDD